MKFLELMKLDATANGLISKKILPISEMESVEDSLTNRNEQTGCEHSTIYLKSNTGM